MSWIPLMRLLIQMKRLMTFIRIRSLRTSTRSTSQKLMKYVRSIGKSETTLIAWKESQLVVPTAVILLNRKCKDCGVLLKLEISLLMNWHLLKSSCITSSHVSLNFARCMLSMLLRWRNTSR